MTIDDDVIRVCVDDFAVVGIIELFVCVCSCAGVRACETCFSLDCMHTKNVQCYTLTVLYTKQQTPFDVAHVFWEYIVRTYVPTIKYTHMRYSDLIHNNMCRALPIVLII